MTFVDPLSMLPGPRKDWCACECGAFGRVKKDGHVANACKCRRCMAPRFKQRGTRDEHKVARDNDGERCVLSGALTGVDVVGDGWAAEVTREKRIAGPVRTAWNKKTRRLMEHRRVYADKAALILTDEKPWLVVQLYDDWRDR